MTHLDLYHRTTPEAAAAIGRDKAMHSKEHDESLYFSTHRDSDNTEGYGGAVVHVRVPEHLAELDDEFPDGEQHYRVNARDLKPQHFVGARRTAAVKRGKPLPKDLEFHFTPSPAKHIHHELELRGGGKQLGKLQWGQDGDISEADAHSDHRRRGIATMLYTKAHELGRERGIEPPGGSVFQTHDGHSFRNSFDAREERPDVSGIPTHERKYGVSDADASLRDHIINDHGMESSADMVRGWDDETAHTAHERMRKYVTPCTWENKTATRTAARGAREEHGWRYEKDTPLVGQLRVTRPDGTEKVHHNFALPKGLTQLRHKDHQPTAFYHGTNREIEGDQIESGRPGNFVKRMKHAYFTDSLEEAQHYARGTGHVYQVRPTDWYGHRSDAKGSAWASESPLDIVEKVSGPEHKTAAAEKDAHKLSFDYEEEYTGGSLYPTESKITAVHPEHGAVGYLQYLQGKTKRSKLKIKMLKVDEDHQRKGYGTALMNNMQERHPNQAIDHGDRTDAGKESWKGYGKGKADKRGRTLASRHPFDQRKTGIQVSHDHHNEYPETWNDSYRTWAREKPDAAAVSQAQERARFEVPTMTMALSDKPEEATETFRHFLRKGGHPLADEGFVQRHHRPEWGQSQAFHSDGQPGVALHEDRWDYGTLAHETAHHLHQVELGRKPQNDQEAHGPDFVRHYQDVLKNFGRGAGDHLGDAYSAAVDRIRTHAGEA